MKQSIKVLLFGIVYALIALFSEDPLSLIYAGLSGLTAIGHVLLDIEERRIERLFYV